MGCKSHLGLKFDVRGEGDDCDSPVVVLKSLLVSTQFLASIVMCEK